MLHVYTPTRVDLLFPQGKHVHHGLSTQSPQFPVCVLIRHETVLMKPLIKDVYVL